MVMLILSTHSLWIELLLVKCSSDVPALDLLKLHRILLTLFADHWRTSSAALIISSDCCLAIHIYEIDSKFISFILPASDSVEYCNYFIFAMRWYFLGSCTLTLSVQVLRWYISSRNLISFDVLAALIFYWLHLWQPGVKWVRNKPSRFLLI